MWIQNTYYFPIKMNLQSIANIFIFQLLISLAWKCQGVDSMLTELSKWSLYYKVYSIHSEHPFWPKIQPLEFDLCIPDVFAQLLAVSPLHIASNYWNRHHVLRSPCFSNNFDVGLHISLIRKHNTTTQWQSAASLS